MDDLCEPGALSSKRQKAMDGTSVAKGAFAIRAILQEKGKNVPGIIDLAAAFMIEHFPILIGHRSTSGAVRLAPWLSPDKYRVVLFGLVPIFVSSAAESFRDVYDFTQDPNSDRYFGFLDVTKILTTLPPEEFGARRFTSETFADFVKSGAFAEFNADNEMIVYSNLTNAARRWTNSAPECTYYAAPTGVDLLRNFESKDGVVYMENVTPQIQVDQLVRLKDITESFNEQVMAYHPRNELTVDRMRDTLDRLNMALHVKPKDTGKEVLARLSRVLTSGSLFPWRRAGLLEEMSRSKATPSSIRLEVNYKSQKSAFVYMLSTLCVIPSIRSVFVDLAGSLYGMSNERGSASRRASKAVDPEARKRADKIKREKSTKQRYDDLDDLALSATIVKLLTQVFTNSSKASPAAWKAVFGTLRSDINAVLSAEISGASETSPSDAISPEAARWFIAEHMNHSMRHGAEGVVEEAKAFPVNFTRTEDVERAKAKINPIADRAAELKARRIMTASANERRHIVEAVDAQVSRGTAIMEEIIRSCVVDGLSPEQAGRRCAIAFGDILCQGDNAELAPLVANKLRVSIAAGGTAGLPPPSPSLVEISSSRSLPNAGIVVGRCDPNPIAEEGVSVPPRPAPMQVAVPSAPAPAPPPLSNPTATPLDFDLSGTAWDTHAIDLSGLELNSPFEDPMSAVWAGDLGVDSLEAESKHPWMV